METNCPFSMGWNDGVLCVLRRLERTLANHGYLSLRMLKRTDPPAFLRACYVTLEVSRVLEERVLACALYIWWLKYDSG